MADNLSPENNQTTYSAIGNAPYTPGAPGTERLALPVAPARAYWEGQMSRYSQMPQPQPSLIQRLFGR